MDRAADERFPVRALPIESSNARAAVGSRLRAARQARSLTIAQVAESAGLTKGFLSRVERDQTSPSISTLVAICEVIELPVGELFRSSDASVVRAEEAPRISLGGVRTAEVLMSPRHDGRFQVIRSVVEPGGNGGDELYTVDAQVELMYVHAGAVMVQFTDREIELQAGDAVTFSGHEPHQWRSETGAELIWVLVPAAWRS